MHRSCCPPSVVYRVGRLVAVLVWGIVSIGTPLALAEQPRPAPGARSVLTIPTPQPTPGANPAPRSLLALPFATSRPAIAAVPAVEVLPPPGPGGEPARPALAEVPAGVMNIVLLGTDRRPDWGDWRTDTIIVVSVNPQAESVGMLSIPRDLWVEIPDLGVGRINTVDFLGEWRAVEGGGPALMKRAIEVNLGLPVHRYARVNLEGFIQIIDALGGVTVDVECPVHDAFLDEPLTGEEGLAPLNLEAGIHHLDGLTALRYARSRQSGTDFDRAYRQQKLLRSLAEQNLNWELILKLPRLWESLGSAVQTDLTLPELVQLASVGLKLRQNRIESRFIDWRTTENWITAGGAYVLLPNHETLPQAVAEFLNPPQEDRSLAVEHARIEIQDATATEGLAQLAEKQLARGGLAVTGTTQIGRLSRSRIIVFSHKPRTQEALQGLLRLENASIIRSPEPHERVDIQIILGSDWQPCP